MKRLLPLFAGVLMTWSARQASGQVIVLYENLAPSNWTTLYPAAADVSTDEIGDEVTLAPGLRTLDTFTVQYGNQGPTLSGNETMRIRFYQNDGALNGQGAAVPNTMIYDSGPLAVSSAVRSVLTLHNLNLTVPDSFTWTVQFTGISGSETVGLAIQGPPTIGSSFNDYWENTGTGWNLYKFSDPSLQASFGAEFTAVPEPVAGGLAVAAALFGSAVIHRSRRRGSFDRSCDR